MSTLTGQKIANTYKQLLQVSTDNSGLSATVQTVQDGAGTNSPLQLSNSTVNINGTFQLSGSTLTATAAELNAIADLTGTTGIVAVSAGQVYGRTLTAGTGVSITNADGTEGNPTIALNPSGVAAGSYGPLSNIAVNSVGQVVSISTETSVSVSVINASSFIGEYLNLSANASIVGDVNIDGNTSIGGSAWINGPVSVIDSLYVGTNLSVTGNTKTDFLYAVSAEIGDLRADTLTFSAVSVSAFSATTLLVANNLTGVSATFSDNVSVATLNAGTNIYIAGSPVALASSLAATSLALATSIDTANTRITSVSDFAVALSATFATSINNSNTNIAAVSALTSVNLESITSINSVINNLDFATSAELAATSLALATSIGTANTRITSVSDFAVALSATFATSIDNSNTNITINANAITSINAVVAGVSVLTSINTAAITSINAIIGDGGNFATSAELATVSAYATSIVQALSATMATSIDNSNTNITTNANAITSINAVVAGVSALTSVNAAAITSINAVIEGDVSADSGTFNTLTVITSASVGGGFNVGGNVGIGRSPGYDLDVYRSGATSTDIAAANDSIVNVLRLNGSTSGQVGTITSHGLELLAGNIVRMTLDSSGNVGVGVTPTYKLDIGGVTESIFRNTGGSVQSAVYSSGGGSQGQFGTFSAHPTVLITSGTEKVRIDSSGNVGIGTSSPDADAKLDVNGQVLVRNTGGAVDTTPGGQYGFYIQPDSSGTVNLMSYSSGGSTDIQFFTNSGGAAAVNAMTITSSGEALIGTTSSGSKLRVSKGSSSNAVLFEGSGYQTYFGYGANEDNYISSGASGNTIFRVGSTEKVRIDSGGNVGIGQTPSAGYTLSVNGSIGGPNAALAIYPSPGVSAQRTFSGSNNANATLHIDHEGGYNRFGCDNTSQHFAFTAGGSTSGDINVVFKGDGNVGIGTTSPAKQLELTKSARATITSLTDGATITPDFDAAQNFAVTLGGNRTLANPSNIDPGQTGSIFVMQDVTGGRTLSFGAYWKFAGGTAPTMSTGASAVDRIDYVVYTSTAIHAVATLNLS